MPVKCINPGSTCDEESALLPKKSLMLALLLGLPVQALPDTSVRELTKENLVAGVYSISELTDVTSADWAFQSLKSLIERYACLEGYPSQTFSGSKTITRFEFAAGLNACLGKVNELIAAGSKDLISKDDLSTINRLEQKFKGDLGLLKSRIGDLEAKTKEIAGEQFSTVTKLNGTAVFSVNGGTADGTLRPLAQNGGAPVLGNAANVTFGGRIRLNFDSRFSKETNDLLKIRVATFSSLGQDSSVSLGSGTRSGQLFFGGTAALAGGSRPGVVTNGNQAASFDKVWYAFNPFKNNNFRVWIGPRVQVIDVLDRNPFLINDENRFSSTLNLFNPLISGYAHLNSGAGFDWRIVDNLSLRMLYSAANAGVSAGSASGGGITGGLTQWISELEYRPFKELGLKVQFTRANVPLVGGNKRVFGASPVLIGSNPVLPAATTFSVVDAVGFNVDWSLSNEVKLFGRFALANSQVTGTGISGTVSANTWLAGLELPDLFTKGNRAGLSVGQPIRITGASGLGAIQADPGTETVAELYYNFKLAKNIELTPDIQAIFNPGNNPANATLYVGTVRTVFSF
jgi:hypothetical protein